MITPSSTDRPSETIYCLKVMDLLLAVLLPFLLSLGESGLHAVQRELEVTVSSLQVPRTLRVLRKETQAPVRC